MPEMIVLQQVSKTYNPGKTNAFTALDGVDCRIDAGCVTILTGPSGSGKTTMLSLIGCMNRPTTGRIHFEGREITSLPERFLSEIRCRDFGFVFQNYNLIRGITVLENVMLPAYPTGVARKSLMSRAMELLDMLGVGRLSRQNVTLLSGGEQQRVAIARSLINDPKVLIADEPTAHLDTRLIQGLIDIIGRLKAAGKTLIIASHDPLIAGSAITDSVIGLRDGRIVDGDPDR
ncbi:MAG: ABC transporter ATP-binding protein [Desulfobacterales bacterium]